MLIPKLLLIIIFFHEQLPKSVKASEVELVTYEVKPYVSGIRIISLHGQNGFIRYSEAGESMIYPDVEVRVILFGYHLDKIGAIWLTTDNCFNAISRIAHSEFTVQTVKRIDFIAYFAESDVPYRICYKERVSSKMSSEEQEDDMTMIDEMRSCISTETPTRIYYLPLYLQISILLVLFCMSALFSGLNLGLMTLSPQELRLIRNSGSSTERKYAETMLPVRQTGNYLLCTILIMNVVVNASISILFGDLTSGIYALIIASLGIVIVGEIIPQSICIKKGLAVGAKTIWLTRTFMILTFPLSYPISKILDLFLGEESPVYDRCKGLLSILYAPKLPEGNISPHRLINLMKMTKNAENQELADDLKIAVGAMEIHGKTVSDILTKIEDVFMVPESLILSTTSIVHIIQQGYSRIPVYKDEDETEIVSLLMVRDLAMIDPRDNFTVRTICEFHNHQLRFVDKSVSLRLMLEEFKEGSYHLAVVQGRYTDAPSKTMIDKKELLGIVTLEDIVEEILQAEIVDESDTVIDNVHRSRRIHKKEPNFTKILAHEEFCKLPISMENMAWICLQESHKIFRNDLISGGLFASIIKQGVKQVNILQTTSTSMRSIRKREKVYLYRKNRPSPRFILILEGRATYRHGNMEFEAGPWTTFGSQILNQLDLDSQMFMWNKHTLKNTIYFTPDFDLYVAGFCRFLQITARSFLYAFNNGRFSRTMRCLYRWNDAISLNAKSANCLYSINDTASANVFANSVSEPKLMDNVRINGIELNQRSTSESIKPIFFDQISLVSENAEFLTAV